MAPYPPRRTGGPSLHATILGRLDASLSAVRQAEAVWWILAAASVTLGVARAVTPDRSDDLRFIYRWVVAWVRQGIDVYNGPLAHMDYPPQAIVVFAPLALVPDVWIPVVWAGCQVVLAVLAGFLAVRVARPATTWRDARLPVLMFLSWGAVRTGIWMGEFSIPLLTLGLAGLVLSRARPYCGGVLIGLAQVKPHIGVPFVICSLLQKRWRVIVTAGVVVVAALLVYSLRVGRDPVVVTISYLDILRQLYVGEAYRAYLVGDADLRPLVRVLVSPGWLADVVHVGIVTLLGMVTWRVVRVFDGDAVVSRDAGLTAMAALLSLLTFFNLRFNLVLALPAMMLLWFSGSGSAPAPASNGWPRLDRWVHALVQLALMLELPWLWHRFLSSRSQTMAAWSAWMAHADRVIVLALFIYLLLRLRAAALSSTRPSR